MGVFSSRSDPAQVDAAAIAEEMRPALYAWFPSQLRFYDPNTMATGDYSGKTDSGSPASATLLFDTGPKGAIVQPIRSPTRIDFANQGSDIIGIRFQTIKGAPAGVLRAGLIVIAVDGGNDDSLPYYQFELQNSADSSLQWGRIMEATLMSGSGTLS